MAGEEGKEDWEGEEGPDRTETLRTLFTPERLMMRAGAGAGGGAMMGPGGGGTVPCRSTTFLGFRLQGGLLLSPNLP